MVESAPARSGMLPSSNDVPVVLGATWAGPLEPSTLCQAPSGRCNPAVRGAIQKAREMKAPRIDPGLRELLGLSLLALGGCSLALLQGDLLFAAIFAAACAVATIEAIRRSR
jgi:hypothetical protein